MKIAEVKVGDEIKFNGSDEIYTVRARSARHLVCTCSTGYTIVDLFNGWRGKENMFFPQPYKTDEDCAAMLYRLGGPWGKPLRLATDLNENSKCRFYVDFVRKGVAA